VRLRIDPAEKTRVCGSIRNQLCLVVLKHPTSHPTVGRKANLRKARFRKYVRITGHGKEKFVAGGIQHQNRATFGAKEKPPSLRCKGQQGA